MIYYLEVSKLVENSRNEIRSIIVKFVNLVAKMKMYPQNHPQVISLLYSFYESIERYLKERSELTLYIIGDDIIVLDKPLPNLGLTEESFIKILNSNSIERVTFLAGLPKPQLYNFFAELASGNKLTLSSASHIKLGKVVFDSLDEYRPDSSFKPVDFTAFNKKASLEIKKLYLDIQNNKMPDTEKAKEIVADFIRIYDKSISPLTVLASIKSADEYTYVHITNVALLTICFADYLGFSGKYLEDIGVAALLHDVGKMFIPDSILQKPGPLNEDERAIMETHTLKGAQFIGIQKNLPKLTMLAALEHHIKYDGSGYPLISQNWQPNITSQMIGIADVYDATRSNRPYQEAMAHDKIRAILQAGKGSNFNPALVENFLRMIER